MTPMPPPADRDAPVGRAQSTLPALLRTSRVSAGYGLCFAAVGVAYATGELLSESFREKDDAMNGAVGGLLAGSVLGVASGRFSVGFGAAAAMAAMSYLVDTTGQTLRNKPSGDLPQRSYFPYETAKSKA